MGKSRKKLLTVLEQKTMPKPKTSGKVATYNDGLAKNQTMVEAKRKGVLVGCALFNIIWIMTPTQVEPLLQDAKGGERKTKWSNRYPSWALLAHNGSDIMLLKAFGCTKVLFLLACRCVYCCPFSFSFGFGMSFFCNCCPFFFFGFCLCTFLLPLIDCCPFSLLLSVRLNLLHKKKASICLWKP